MFSKVRRSLLLSLMVAALGTGCASQNVVDIKYEAPAGLMSNGGATPPKTLYPV